MKQKFQIDATGKSMGRIASEAASFLMGKNSTEFARNIVAAVEVEITNLSKIKIDQRKAMSKYYYRHSGYIGSTKKVSLLELFEKDVISLMKHTISGMLPDNRLRKSRLNNLKLFSEDK